MLPTVADRAFPVELLPHIFGPARHLGILSTSLRSESKDLLAS